MLGIRAVLTIIGIISGCSLVLFLLACCLVYYRRQQQRKDPVYAAASPQNDDEERNVDQTENFNQPNNSYPDSPPPYSEVAQRLN